MTQKVLKRTRMNHINVSFTTTTLKTGTRGNRVLQIDNTRICRWFDKSLQIIVSNSGRAGVNGEVSFTFRRRRLIVFSIPHLMRSFLVS